MIEPGTYNSKHGIRIAFLKEIWPRKNEFQINDEFHKKLNFVLRNNPRFDATCVIESIHVSDVGCSIRRPLKYGSKIVEDEYKRLVREQNINKIIN